MPISETEGVNNFKITGLPIFYPATQDRKFYLSTQHLFLFLEIFLLLFTAAPTTTALPVDKKKTEHHRGQLFFPLSPTSLSKPWAHATRTSLLPPLLSPQTPSIFSGELSYLAPLCMQLTCLVSANRSKQFHSALPSLSTPKSPTFF